MVLVRRIGMQDALKLAIFLTLVTFSSNLQDSGTYYRVFDFTYYFFVGKLFMKLFLR
jgi:hypothetical protein